MTLIGWRRADHRLALSGHGIAGLTPRTARRADALPLGVTTRAGRTDEALHATDGAAEARIVREALPGLARPMLTAAKRTGDRHRRRSGR